MVRPLAHFVLAALATAASAQGSVSGRVTDGETGEPLPGVHVYLDGTTAGAVTDRTGAYRIDGVPVGAHVLVATFVGYAPGVRPLGARAGDLTADVRLRPRTEALGGLTVEGDRSAWLRQLDRFRRAFVGGSRDARAVRLLNPEVLAFEEADGLLRARGEGPLRFENRALGYRVAYDLADFALAGEAVAFRGWARFRPLEPTDEDERARWAAARRRAYAGSFAHFVHTLAAGRLSGSGFRVYRANTRHRLPPSQALDGDRLDPVEDGALVLRRIGPDEGVLTADPALYLRVDYTGEREERAFRAAANRGRDPRLVRRRSGDQVSWVETPDGAARVNLRTGQLAGAGRGVYPLLVSGYWAWDERAARWLPSDYRPDGDL